LSKDEKKTLAFIEGLRKRCPDHVPVLEVLGDMYTRTGRYEEGLAIDLGLVGRDSGNSTYWYNLACSYCRLKQFDECLNALKTAIERGYSDFKWMMRDDDLAGIRQHAGFKQLLSLVKKS